MDLSNPLRSIAPTVDADVLQVLGRAHTRLNGARIARLAERSYAQVHAVLGRLVAHGLVDVEHHGNTNAYALNREHVLAGAVNTAATVGSELDERMRVELASWEVAAVSVAVFGSLARRDGTADSDIDLFVVRPDSVAPDDAAWTEARHAFARAVERWTGNSVQMVEVSARELTQAVASSQPLIASLRSDARTVFGSRLDALLSQPSATMDA